MLVVNQDKRKKKVSLSYINIFSAGVFITSKFYNDNKIDNIRKKIFALSSNIILWKRLSINGGISWWFCFIILLSVMLSTEKKKEKEFKSHRYIAFSLGNISSKFNIDIYVCIQVRCLSISCMIETYKSINCTSFNQWIDG